MKVDRNHHDTPLGKKLSSGNLTKKPLPLSLSNKDLKLMTLLHPSRWNMLTVLEDLDVTFNPEYSAPLSGSLLIHQEFTLTRDDKTLKYTAPFPTDYIMLSFMPLSAVRQEFFSSQVPLELSEFSSTVKDLVHALQEDTNESIQRTKALTRRIRREYYRALPLAFIDIMCTPDFQSKALESGILSDIDLEAFYL